MEFRAAYYINMQQFCASLDHATKPAQELADGDD